MAGAFDVPMGAAIPLLSTTATLLASLLAWTLFHRDQSRGDLGRRVFDGLIALSPVALVASATSLHASAATLAMLCGVMLCGIVYVAAYEAIRLETPSAVESLSRHGVGAAPLAEGAAVRHSLSSPDDEHSAGGQTADETIPHEHFERRVLPGGGEEIEAVLTARFLPGQRQTAVHLPIHPVLPRPPHVECEPLDGSDVELQTTSVYGYGVRVEVKRTADNDAEAAVPIGLLVTTADPDVSAA